METIPAASELRIGRVEVESILALRWDRLIAGTGRPSAEFEGDGDPRARHYAARSGEAIVGCATAFPSAWEGSPAWQLRGMAVAADWAGRGVGRRLLDFIDADLAGEGSAAQIWCNARDYAVGFYEKLGWRTASAPFMIPGVCPHLKMVKPLAGA